MTEILDEIHSRIREEVTNYSKEGLEQNTPFSAIATILLTAAYSDLNYSEVEMDEVVKLIRKEFALDQEQEQFLSSLAVEVMASPNRFDQSIDLINNENTPEIRIKILAMAWKVILIDGKVEPGEQKLASSLEKRLNLSVDQGYEARQMVIGGSI